MSIRNPKSWSAPHICYQTPPACLAELRGWCLSPLGLLLQSPQLLSFKCSLWPWPAGVCKQVLGTLQCTNLDFSFHLQSNCLRKTKASLSASALQSHLVLSLAGRHFPKLYPTWRQFQGCILQFKQRSLSSPAPTNTHVIQAPSILLCPLSTPA